VTLAVTLVAVGVACGHAGTAPATLATADGHRAATLPSGPPQYVVADPNNRGRMISRPLAGGAIGMVVDRMRVIVGRDEPRVGADLPAGPIVRALEIPRRFKGGYLFATDNVVYRSDTFDGRLDPVARFPDGILTVSFGPKFFLVRTRNGERWAISLPGGDRVPVEPLGVLDVEGLEDGRALAFDEKGAAFSSLDHGAHWLDVTSHLKSSPTRVASVDGEVWVFESNGGGIRLEPDGQISSFDKQPTEKSIEIRARDPRWRGNDAPLRVAMESGASLDENTALVIVQGDVVRVDVHTGEIVGVLAGKLPPDAQCEALPGGELLFVCSARNGTNGAGPGVFVVSHAASDSPVVEQTFTTGGSFYASDDGGLAFGGPCPTGGGADDAVCVRQPGGAWREMDPGALGTDGGFGRATVARWIPRADGTAVAVVFDPGAGLYDPRTGVVSPLDDAARELAVGSSGGSASRRRQQKFDAAGVVDGSWSFAPSGALRVWNARGAIAEIDPSSGKVTRSPYSFDLAFAGANGLGRTREGRLFQSSDHGLTWTEVAEPPSGRGTSEVHECSAVGCDMGGFYRIGWAVRPPRVATPTTDARPVPEVRRTRSPELTCRPAGPVQSKLLRRTENTPEDLGLGHSRLPVASERNDHAFVRSTIARGIQSPVHDPSSGNNDPDLAGLRAMFTGFGTTHDRDVLEVTGPNKSANALRRAFSFVPPFDPASPVKRAAIAMSEVLAAGRVAGMTTDEILQDDMTESGSVTVVTPHDPAASSDLAVFNPRGLVALVRANERVRVAMRPSAQNEAALISGVALPGDEAAFLEVETSSGVGHVYRVSGSTISDLFDVRPTLGDSSFYPANPDALAVSGRGDLATISLPTGSEPPSSADPAILMLPSGQVTALAPWSSLRPADDPACKEPGWRTTLQIIAPWVRITNQELRTDEAPMLARVKWSEKRVCLEGLEVKVADVQLRIPAETTSESQRVGSWLVSRGNSYARVAIAEGVEWRQPMECTWGSAPAAPATSATPKTP